YLSYQWFKNGAAIAGATANTYTTPPLQAPDAGSSYYASVGNGAGSANSSSAKLSLTDTEAPRISCPPDVAAPAAAAATVVVYPAPTVTDNCDPNPQVVCNPPSGSVFPAGNTVVTCVATDAAGNSSSCQFNVYVNPGARFLSGFLPPPNGKYASLPGTLVRYCGVAGAPPVIISNICHSLF